MAINPHPVGFLLSFLCAFSLSAATVFLSIDCGSSIASTDSYGIQWTGDSAYVQTGKSKVTQNGPDNVLSTLRVFTSHKKNCYTFPGEQGSKLLLRASFFYGNYDFKSAPPSFDLQFDGNEWITVHTSLDQIVTHEVTYNPKWKNISLCLAQKSADQFPFISSIEVRSLASKFYNLQDISKYPLFLNQRISYTSGVAVVRYNYDPYDRIWTRIDSSTISQNDWIEITTNALTVDVSKTADDPPPRLLYYGVETASRGTNLALDVSTLPSTQVPVYMNMYFTEVFDPADLNSSGTRSFNVVLDKQTIASDITPVFGNATEIRMTNLTASSGSNLYLTATSSSTLPPSIFGMELFVIGTTPLTNGSNTKDESGLASLQNRFPVLQEWSGDPCLPAAYPWDWVNCTTDATPRVIALLLKGYGLSGKLPDFSSLDAIQSIDMSNNNITGPIPNFLNSSTNLTYLNLANNNFTGLIPLWLYQKNNLKFNISGNQYLCNSTSCMPEYSPTTVGDAMGQWLAGVIGGVLSTLIAAAILYGVRQWKLSSKRNRPSGTDAGQPNEEEESATPQTLVQNGTNNNKLEDKMSKIITDKGVDRAVQTEIDHEFDVQPSTTTTT